MGKILTIILCFFSLELYAGNFKALNTICYQQSNEFICRGNLENTGALFNAGKDILFSYNSNVHNIYITNTSKTDNIYVDYRGVYSIGAIVGKPFSQSYTTINKLIKLPPGTSCFPGVDGGCNNFNQITMVADGIIYDDMTIVDNGTASNYMFNFNLQDNYKMTLLLKGLCIPFSGKNEKI